MTHGDDDGLRLPPAIAPRQVVIVPMLRDKPEDAECWPYCEALAKELKAAGIRTLVDLETRPKSAEKRWNWVRRGAPIIVEIGGRDAAGGKVTFMRRDRLRDGDKVISITMPRADFVAGAPALLEEIQASALCRGQGAARRQHHHGHHDLRASSPSTSARPKATTKAAPSRAGCACPGRDRPARRWKPSRSG